MIWSWKLRSVPPPSVFICGCGHSGTSILAAILAAHPDLYVLPRETGAFLGGETAARANFASIVNEHVASGRRILVEKTPRHVRRIDFIRKVVPGAKFILPVRDGRDVATSIEQRTGDLTEGQDRWVQDNFLVSQETNSPDCFVYRYEDFIEDPSSIVRHICEFIGVEFTPELLNYHRSERLWFGENKVEDRNPARDGHKAHRNWQINQPLFDGRGKWRTSHAEADFHLLNSGKGQFLMRQYRYADTPEGEAELRIEVFDRPLQSPRSWKDGQGQWVFDDFLAEEHHRQYGRPWSIGRGYVNYLIARNVRPSDKVLDFGCGAGRVGIFLIPYLAAGNYYGIDNHIGSLEAFARYEAPLHQLAIQRPRIAVSDKMQFEKFETVFDVVLDLHVSQHMRDPLGFYANASKVLADGGRLFVPHKPVPSLSDLTAIDLKLVHEEVHPTFLLSQRGSAQSPKGKQWSKTEDHWHILQKSSSGQ